MVKGTYQLPPCMLMKLLHSSICGLLDLSSLVMASPMLELVISPTRVSNMLMQWNSENWDLLLWAKLCVKFKITLAKVGDWITLAIKVIDKCHHMLDNNLNIMLPCQWIGLYLDFEANPAFVMQCSTTFTTSCMHLYGFSMSLLPTCFMVGTCSWRPSEWENPTSYMVGFLHEMKIIHATKGKTTTPSGI